MSEYFAEAIERYLNSGTEYDWLQLESQISTLMDSERELIYHFVQMLINNSFIQGDILLEFRHLKDRLASSSL